MPKLARRLIGEEPGRGGMGVVYAATDRDTGEPCAIKIITTGPDASWSHCADKVSEVSPS